MSAEDTIAAVATAPGTGAIAVIRVSGPQAHAVQQTCTGRRLSPRYATLVRVRNAQGLVVDDVLATWFPSPASFTGEDVVEISCHGGMLVTQRVLECLLAAGARPAEPGEFSRRAFLNGKMDLTQAEAVMDVISAGCDLALRAAHNQLHGAIADRVQAAADILIDVAAHTEAYIDFPEEDISPSTIDSLIAQLDSATDMLATLLSTAADSRVLREGIRTAIIGAPNVGKSSLLNMLLGYERAIVSSTAGTTRDTIEESVALGGLLLRLIDTAGLHESTDAIELAGMDRSRRAGASADLVLEVADCTRPPVDIPLPAESAAHILILNKCDLPEHPDWAGRPAVRLSCHQQSGRPELESAVKELFLHHSGDRDSLVAINARHRFALSQALTSLARAREGFLSGQSPEFTDVDLREALDSLGSITGRIDTEDILTRVFSTFCLGK